MENMSENAFKMYEHYRDKYERTKNNSNNIIVSNIEEKESLNESFFFLLFNQLRKGNIKNGYYKSGMSWEK